MKKELVHVVTAAAMLTVIATCQPLGLFLCKEGRKCWTAVDNRNGTAWTESFFSKRKAKSWLRQW